MQYIKAKGKRFPYHIVGKVLPQPKGKVYVWNSHLSVCGSFGGSSFPHINEPGNSLVAHVINEIGTSFDLFDEVSNTEMICRNCLKFHKPEQPTQQVLL